MDLRALRYFAEVVREGGFSAAAKTAFATQPTLSKAVRQLEDELGLPLLERIGHRILPTPAGEIVYRRALGLLAARQDLLAELDDLRGLRRGVLRLGLPVLGSHLLFAPLFATYRQRYPGVEIQLLERGSQFMEEAVLAGQIELAGSLLPIPETFDWQMVCEEPMVALLPRAHPLAGTPAVTLAELADSAFILFEGGFALNRIIINACQQLGFTPREAARSAQPDFIVALVAAGLGIGLLPRLIAEQRPHPQVCYAPLAGEQAPRWQLALSWRRGSYLSPAARAWLDLARTIGGTSS